jgi:predicted RNA-binding protein with PUA-like domain
MKSEPDTYSIDDLRRDGHTCWEGVRNYQARNFMRDDMAVGDQVLFYHSRTKPPGVVGLATVTRAGYVDHFALDPDHPYFDAKSKPDAPRWVMVDIGWAETFPTLVSLAVLKDDPALDGMLVARKGQRLSVQPVDPEHFARVVELGRTAD